MFTPARALAIDANQRRRLRFLATSDQTPPGVALQVRNPLLASEGVPNNGNATRGVIGILRRLIRRLQAAFPAHYAPGRLGWGYPQPCGPHIPEAEGVAYRLAMASSPKLAKRIRRLLVIDAPEVPLGDKRGQPFGEEARDYLDHLIGGKTVRVDTYGPDRWKNRILAVIFEGQVNINLLMVAMGYAEVYRGASCQVFCRELEEAEAKARRDQVGMWVPGEKYESPAAFRRRVRIRGD